MKNENKMDDMVDILTHMHQYVPLHAVEKTVEVSGTDYSEHIKLETLHHILIGGDQLTAERVKGARSLRKNSTSALGRLEGLVPVSEDWHAKVCFLQVVHAQNQIIGVARDIFIVIGYMETSVWQGKFIYRVRNTLTT